MTDIPIYLSCKFEMYIFEIVLVMNENARASRILNLANVFHHSHDIISILNEAP